MALLALGALSACGGGPRPSPPPLPPAAYGVTLPADAPLTAVVRPAGLRAALAEAGLEAGMAGPADLRTPTAMAPEALAGLGIDPGQPVWVALRAGPVLGVLRAAEDTERMLADLEPAADPSPATPLAAAPFHRWLDAHPLPPAWIHLRLVGRPAAGPEGRAVDPGTWLNATQGGLAVARAADPAETLAATLDTESGPAGALQTALAGIEPTVYRLLGQGPATAVVVHRVDGSGGPAQVVDVLWDRELGAGGLVAALAALPEAGGAWSEGPLLPFGWPAEDELLRLGVRHGKWFAAGRMLREVQALQAVLGQGMLSPGTRHALAASRREALLPERLMAPVSRALVESTLTLARIDGRLRLQLVGETRSAALSTLRDGTAPVDHGIAADGLPPSGGLALTLALAPVEFGRVLGPHIGPPDQPLGAMIDAVGRCGVACLPALWSVLAYARDLPATIAAMSGHAPLESALAEATGLALLSIDGVSAAAVGHRAPATLPRAAWGPIVEAAGLESRWLVGDRAVMVAGRDDPLAVLERAARGPAVSDAAALRFTWIRPAPSPDRPPLAFDGALSFDPQGVTLDVVIDRVDAPPQ